MHNLHVQDVNQALAEGIAIVLSYGVEENSRNGPVLVVPEPVCIEYTQPQRRVLLSPMRDANPFFHFFEALWMLAGRRDIAFPDYFSRKYRQFSDDGETMWDAYGFRWRKFFGWDQLKQISEELKSNPNSRRCVLSMWNSYAQAEYFPTDKYEHDYTEDFYVATHGGKAVPCNTHAYFDVRGGKLNMTVMNRSNDAILGCFGANAVHFSFLLEYMAMKIGVPMGVYRQFTNNLHIYTNTWSRATLCQIMTESDLRTSEVTGPEMEERFEEDLKTFMGWADQVRTNRHGMTIPPWHTRLFNTVVEPMFLAWSIRKQRTVREDLFLDQFNFNDQMTRLRESSEAWGVACQEWIDRRRK